MEVCIGKKGISRGLFLFEPSSVSLKKLFLLVLFLGGSMDG